MIVVLHVGSHEVRFAEPGLVSVRCSGDLRLSEAMEILLLAREHLTGRDGRILLDASQLGSLPPDGLHELEALRRELEDDACPIRQVALVRPHMLHKVMLLPLLSRQSDERGARFAARFFQSQSDALVWLDLPASSLFAGKDSIFVTERMSS